MAELRIDTNSDRLAERKLEKQKKQQLTYIIVGGVGVVGILVVLIIVSALNKPKVQPPGPSADGPPAQQPDTGGNEPVEGPKPPIAKPSNRIADDGRTMWASPTDGQVIDLAWLPLGTQFVFHARPASLASTGEIEKVIASLGPGASSGISWLENLVGQRFATYDSITVGLRPASKFVPEWSVVVKLPAGSEAAGSFGGLDPGASKSQGNYSLRKSNDGRLVIASRSIAAELEELGGTPPVLRRELDGLLSSSDGDRHMTLLVAPSFLFGEGRQALADSRKSLGQRLIPLLPTDIKALCISVHWDESFFSELLVAPTGGTKPRDVASMFRSEIARWPVEAEDAMLGLTNSEYGRRVVARLPAMLRAMARYTRDDIERTHAVMRCYLPKQAGHSLLMAAELMMAYRSAGPGAVAVASNPPAAQPTTLADKLAKPTTLTFNRDTLEMAIKLLSEDTGIPITINGGDLQLDGITKNQSFGIDLQNKPASEILIAILRLANPDKTATAANDGKQKLVYIIGPGDSIIVTTRSAAAKRGDELPQAFVVEE